MAQTNQAIELTPRQVAEAVGCTLNAVYKAIETGNISAREVEIAPNDKRLFISVEETARWKNERRVGATGPRKRKAQ